MTVVIIGAGIAGLSCGYTLDVLSAGNVDLKILEARSAVGGRIQNVEGVSFIDFDLDLGGQDLFLNDRSVYEGILGGGDESDFTTLSWFPDDIDYCEKATTCNGSFRTDLADASFVGESLANFINKFLLPRVENDVILNTAVTKIDYSDSTKIVLTTSNGSTIDADKLVVSVPLAQLRNDSTNPIEFVPELPVRQRNAIERARFESGGVRVFAEFSEKFYDDATKVGGETYYDASRGKSNPYCTAAWENVGDDCTRRDEQTSCNASRNKHFCRCNILTPIEEPTGTDVKVCRSTTDTIEAIVDLNGGTCNAWCGNLGSKNIVTIRNGKMASSTNQEIRKKFLDDLDDAYDGKARETLLNSYIINYEKEDYIEMATISPSGQGDLGAYDEPIADGRIYFAGDFTRKFNNNKAGESGVEVAQDICAASEDDPSWEREFTNSKGEIKIKGCIWVAKRPNNRCNKGGFLNGEGEEVKASKACPVACNTCG